MTHDHDQHADGYVAAIERDRASKDASFRDSPSSPIPAAARREFPGLPYFAVDPALRQAGLRLDAYAGTEPSEFQIPTSDGQLRPARRAGSFTFEVRGERQRLTAYVLEGGRAESLFVPFLDETSGRETYGAGRFLDLEAGADGTYVIDFNLAYHPKCVYATGFSCPLTPAENRLPVRIEAGERLSTVPAAH